jgi:integrase
VGELVALRWTDYDGKNITVTRTYGKFGYGPPKSGRPRTVHVSPELRKVLDSRDRRFDLIFSETGGPLTTASKDYPGPGTFHSLRHTYAALMLAAGVSPKYLQEQMGHASIQTTLDLYGHLVPEIHAGSLAKLDALVLDSRVVRLERRAGDGQG